MWYVPPIRRQRGDPHGAGDAFIGSLGRLLAEGLFSSGAIRPGHAVAAFSVTRIGTHGVVSTRSASDAFFAQHGIV